MKILVINAGSSSLKFQLINTQTEEMLAKGYVQRIGSNDSFADFKSLKGSDTVKTLIADHDKALDISLKFLTDKNFGVISNLKEIDAVGHRIVHGAEKYKTSVVITDSVLTDLKKFIPLAPLHLPAGILGVEASIKNMPGKKQVAVFDTSFHSTLPEHAFLYALPYEYYSKHKIRRYGFHGSSHMFMAQEVAKLIGNLKGKKVISCHLGNGSSITAIKDGISIDTTMGYTPLEGLMMGTRSGDIDPNIITEIMKIEKVDVAGAIDFLNKKCGIQGITGFTNDMRDIRDTMHENLKSKLAFDMLAYRITKYIGAYTTAMGGVDAIVFTGGIGENDEPLREKVCKNLEFLGVDFDYELNYKIPRGTTVELTKPNSKVRIFRIPTNEELVIARETAALCK